MSLNCANHPQTEALVVHEGNSLCKECYEKRLRERQQRALKGLGGFPSDPDLRGQTETDG